MPYVFSHFDRLSVNGFIHCECDSVSLDHASSEVEGRFLETTQVSIILRQVHHVRVIFTNAELDNDHFEKSETINKRQIGESNFQKY